MTYVLLLYISGTLYFHRSNLTYEECRSERTYELHKWERAKAEGLFTGKAIVLCQLEE